jgi:hypothetical protein
LQPNGCSCKLVLLASTGDWSLATSAVASFTEQALEVCTLSYVTQLHWNIVLCVLYNLTKLPVLFFPHYISWLICSLGEFEDRYCALRQSCFFLCNTEALLYHYIGIYCSCILVWLDYQSYSYYITFHGGFAFEGRYCALCFETNVSIYVTPKGLHFFVTIWILDNDVMSLLRQL